MLDDTLHGKEKAAAGVSLGERGIGDADRDNSDEAGRVWVGYLRHLGHYGSNSSPWTPRSTGNFRSGHSYITVIIRKRSAFTFTLVGDGFVGYHPLVGLLSRCCGGKI